MAHGNTTSNWVTTWLDKIEEEVAARWRDDFDVVDVEKLAAEMNDLFPALAYDECCDCGEVMPLGPLRFTGGTVIAFATTARRISNEQSVTLHNAWRRRQRRRLKRRLA